MTAVPDFLDDIERPWPTRPPDPLELDELVGQAAAKLAPFFARHDWRWAQGRRGPSVVPTEGRIALTIRRLLDTVLAGDEWARTGHVSVRLVDGHLRVDLEVADLDLIDWDRLE